MHEALLKEEFDRTDVYARSFGDVFSVQLLTALNYLYLRIIGIYAWLLFFIFLYFLREVV